MYTEDYSWMMTSDGVPKLDEGHGHDQAERDLTAAQLVGYKSSSHPVRDCVEEAPAPQDPTAAERKKIEDGYPRLKGTQWKIRGRPGWHLNCFGWALGLDDWVEDGEADDELNETFVYKKLRDNGFEKVNPPPPATGWTIALYRFPSREIIHFARIVDGKTSCKLGNWELIDQDHPDDTTGGTGDEDFGAVVEYWHKAGTPRFNLTAMEQHQEPTEDELAVVQEHANLTRQSLKTTTPKVPKAPAKVPPKTTTPAKVPPKTTTPPKVPPKTTPPPKSPPKTTSPPKSPPKTTTPPKNPPKTGTPPPSSKPDNKLTADFIKAYTAWSAAVAKSPSSKSGRWLKLPAYANLKKLGPGIVPLLTDKLAKGDVIAARALYDIDKAKLKGKVNSGTLKQFASVVLKAEAASAGTTKKTIAAFAERKDELNTNQHSETPSAAAIEEAHQKVLVDPLFQAVVERGHAAVPEILARLQHEHEHETDPHGHNHNIWLEVLAQIHAAELHGDRNIKAEQHEFEAWLDKYVHEEEEEHQEEEHHEGHHEGLVEEEQEVGEDAEE
ncbi:hypothetical protein GQ53DRAFT_842158 [Thozetella sp. PMI_491]|nr:hypothetical protein GQ53DRAFT_842158 [Thozetella sp. PMI_491]